MNLNIIVYLIFFGLLLANPLMFIIILICYLIFKNRLVWIPLPLVLIAYAWWKIEPAYWYLKLWIRDNIFKSVRKAQFKLTRNR